MIASTVSIRIYYEDTDAGGVVYYVNYLKYLERGRTEYLRELGFSQNYMQHDNIIFVVKNVNVNYRTPARLDDELLVQTKITQLKSASIIFNQTITKDATVILDATVRIACVAFTDFKVTAIPRLVSLKIRQQIS